MRTISRYLAYSVLLGAGSLLPVAAQAQDYPEKPVTIVISGQVGGTIDGMARQLVPFWSKAFGQNFEIDNRSGAGGATGVRFFMEQPRDGYTIMVGTEAHYTAALESDDSLKPTDIELINMMQFDPVALTVMENSGLDSMKTLVEKAKANPDSLTWGSVANGVPALVGNIVAKEWDLDVRFVPQSGGSESDTALLGGHVDFKLGTAKGDSTELPGAKVIAVAAPTRLGYLPDVPTFKEVAAELGLSDNIPSLGSSRLIWVHAEMKENHPERFQRLVDSYHEAMKDPEYVALLESSGEAPHMLVMAPEEATKQFRELSATSIALRSAAQ